MLQSLTDTAPADRPHHPASLRPMLTAEKNASRPCNMVLSPHVPREISRRTGKGSRSEPIRSRPARRAALLKATADSKGLHRVAAPLMLMSSETLMPTKLIVNFNTASIVSKLSESVNVSPNGGTCVSEYRHVHTV